MIDFKDKAMGYPTTLAPTGTWPLDSRSYFESKADADIAAGKAAETSLSGTSMYYIGQHITVYDPTEHSVKLYYIGEDKALHLMEDDEMAQKTAAYLSNAISSKIFVKNFDEDGNVISAYTDLSVLKISKAEYEYDVVSAATNILSNTIYIVSADFIDAYGQVIKNVANPVDLSDATNKKYVDASVTSARQDLSNYVTTKSGLIMAEVQAKVDVLSTSIDDKVIVDGLSSTQLSLIHIDVHDYVPMLSTEEILSNQLYVVSSDYIDAFGQPVANVAEPTNLSDATPKFFVDNAICAISTSLSTAFDGKLAEAAADSAYISGAVDKKVIVDGLSAADLSLIHDAISSYREKLSTDQVLSNQLYVISADYVDAYGQVVKNVADPIELSDATNKTYVDGKATQLQGKLTAAHYALSDVASIQLDQTSELSNVTSSVMAIKDLIVALYNSLA